MRPDLTDLRLLRLAAFYEATYERFVQHVAAPMTQSKEIREGLADITDALREHHDAIVKEIGRISGRLLPHDHQDLLRAVLQDVVEIERGSRDFFLVKLDEAHDERVVRLFQRLAYEEERQRRVAERLLEALDRQHGARDHAPAAEDLQFVHDLEAFIAVKEA